MDTLFWIRTGFGYVLDTVWIRRGYFGYVLDTEHFGYEIIFGYVFGICLLVGLLFVSFARFGQTVMPTRPGTQARSKGRIHNAVLQGCGKFL